MPLPIGNTKAPHNAQPACGLNPQQHRGQGCHIHTTSAQGDTRASFILELVQGHSLLVALDINHTITCDVRPSAYLACHHGASHGVGDTFR